MADPSNPDPVARANMRFQQCILAIFGTDAERKAADQTDFNFMEAVLHGRPDGPPPTEAEFRLAGFTAGAARWPLAGPEYLWLCLLNGADPDKAPHTWWYAPNEAARESLRARVEALRLPGIDWR